MYDLCIVGAGMFGSAAARHASADPSLKVVLIGPAEPKKDEWQQREIFSSYYDEGRITRILDEYEECQVLSKHSINRYRELEKLSGIQFYQSLGYLCVGIKNSAYMEQTKQAASTGKVPILDFTADDIKRRYPFMSFKPDEIGYFDDNGAGHISPRRMVAAQQKVAEQQGCTIICDVVTEVKPLQKKEDVSFHEVKTKTGKVINAKRVLICTGSFTNFNQVIPNPNNLKPDITIYKETVALLKISKEEVERLSSMPSIVYMREENPKISVYILPPVTYPDGHYYLKIGKVNDPTDVIKTLKEIKQWYLSTGDPKVVKSISEILKSILPGLKVIDIKGATCVTCKSPSNMPYIDRISSTVTVGIVGNGKGAKFSDEVGRIAAELAVHGKWDSELHQSVFSIIWKNSE